MNKLHTCYKERLVHVRRKNRKSVVCISQSSDKGIMCFVKYCYEKGLCLARALEGI